MKKCLVEGCENPSRRHGLCTMHESRVARYGDVNATKYGRESLEVAFWMKVDKRGPDECWPWLGAVGSTGYGVMTRDYKPLAAHRVAYELAKGPIPKGMMIDHLCRNRLCENAAHLEAVSHVTNMGRTRKEYCSRGHEMTPENSYWNRTRNTRACKECIRLQRIAAREKALQLRASVSL